MFLDSANIWGVAERKIQKKYGKGEIRTHEDLRPFPNLIGREFSSFSAKSLRETPYNRSATLPYLEKKVQIKKFTFRLKCVTKITKKQFLLKNE